MLTKEELKKLRSEISLGSIFTKDYINSLGISPAKAQDFFDSYIENLFDLAKEEKVVDTDNFSVVLDNYDSEDNLWNYYCSFEGDPLSN